MSEPEKIKKLDIAHKLPLKGISLVEASAGTGKTFSITKIILQAILVEEISIEEILVVTFTEPATKELRARIRKELHDFEKYISPDAAKQKPDDVYENIIAITGKSEEKLLKLIRAALMNIDQAAVYTIHSFCQRMLTENAFESRIAFGAELVPDKSDLIKEIAENFWRRNMIDISTEVKELYAKFDFSSICKLTDMFVKYHMIELVNTPLMSFEEIKSQYSGSLQAINDEFESIGIENLQKEMMEYFGLHSVYLKKPYGSKYYVETIQNAINQIGSNSLTIKDMEIFHRQTISSYLNAKAGKENFKLPLSPPYDRIEPKIDNYLEIRSQSNSVIFKTLFDYASEEFESIKKERHILTFDDLICKLYSLIVEESENRFQPLTDLIRSKYRIAFVDEFQDTDKLQYDIFKNIFGESTDHGFYMIGDPKQSIYKFRGADIFSYLQAKKDSNEQYTLLHNYRSEQGMIDAANAVFDFRKKLIKEKIDNSASPEKIKDLNPEDVFVHSGENGSEGIQFQPACFGNSSEKTVLRTKGKKQNLQIWLVDGMNKDLMHKNIERNIAAEIISLQKEAENETAYFESASGEKNLELGHIAILVNKNKQAFKMKHELSKCNIPAVIQSTATIFESRQACEFKFWLNAVIKPTERNIRNLFVTDILSKNVHEINKMEPADLLEITQKLALIKHKWQKNGFFSSFMNFLYEFDVIEKALKDQNGERIITNYFHLADLLHQHEIKNGRNVEKTLSYLLQEIKECSSEDEKQEQLESDRNAVKIMTIHKSKGLQFPIVFCPFMWDNSVTIGESDERPLIFSQKDGNGYKQKMDLGAERDVFEEHRKFAREETLAEYVRLLYVALTRAANRCYLGIGNSDSVGSSVLAYVFGDIAVDYVNNVNGRGSKSNRVKYQNECFANLKNQFPDDGRGKFNNIISIETKKQINDSLSLERKNTVKGTDLSVRKLKIKISKDWGVGSFSGLIANIPYSSEPAKSGDGAFGLPKGKNFGTAVHKVFENYYLDKQIFNDPESRKHCFEAPLQSESYFRSQDPFESEKRFHIAEQMFKKTLTAEIKSGDNLFKLEDVETKDAKPEFSFYHRINKISPALLSKLFADFASENMEDFSKKIEELGFSLKKGYMNGEIDLLFRENDKYFVLDWKTNHLGPYFKNYSSNKIKENMFEHYYILQAHVYTLATHLYLKQKLPGYDYDKNFGGYIYVYVRGVDGKGNGVFHDLPKKDLIENMEKELCS